MFLLYVFVKVNENCNHQLVSQLLILVVGDELFSVPIFVFYDHSSNYVDSLNDRNLLVVYDFFMVGSEIMVVLHGMVSNNNGNV